MLQWIFILIACLICACSSAKPVDNPTAENPITQPHTDTNPAPSPISPKEAIPMNNHDNAIDSWIDPLKPGFVMPKSDEATQILEFVRNHSKHESFVARIKLGNMAFVEGTTPT